MKFLSYHWMNLGKAFQKDITFVHLTGTPLWDCRIQEIFSERRGNIWELKKWEPFFPWEVFAEYVLHWPSTNLTPNFPADMSWFRTWVKPFFFGNCRNNLARLHHKNRSKMGRLSGEILIPFSGPCALSFEVPFLSIHYLCISNTYPKRISCSL